MIDELLIHGLHVEASGIADVGAGGAASHELFQASTLAALLSGSFDGDLTFAELARHGDFGLGTLNGLDGEMIALDGRFLRADANGDIDEIPPTARTPFAVVTRFRPTVTFDIEEPLDQGGLATEINRHAPPGSPSCAVRLDGEFELVHARSVPRQEPPYRTLAEVAADQHEFDFQDIEGTVVGFRFPAYAEGIELPGFHLHFVDAEHCRGGHVLGCRVRRAKVPIDHASRLHLELPPGVELPAPPDPGGAGRTALRRIEGG